MTFLNLEIYFKCMFLGPQIFLTSTSRNSRISEVTNTMLKNTILQFTKTFKLTKQKMRSPESHFFQTQRLSDLEEEPNQTLWGLSVCTAAYTANYERLYWLRSSLVVSMPKRSRSRSRSRGSRRRRSTSGGRRTESRSKNGHGKPKELERRSSNKRSRFAKT